jgi:hypothetical protein
MGLSSNNIKILNSKVANKEPWRRISVSKDPLNLMAKTRGLKNIIKFVLIWIECNI